MTEEEKKKMADLEAKVATLETEKETLTKERDEFKDSNTKLGEDLSAKDTRIGELETAAKEKGMEFKKLRDMTDAEKELLSEKEKEIMARQEKFEEDQANFQKDQADYRAKERTARIDSIATRLAKGDKEVAAQIKVKLNGLNQEELAKAQTEDELAPFITDAFNLTGLGNQQGDPLRKAHNEGGGAGEYKKDDDFAATEAGKTLAGALGLQQATPEGQKAIADGGTQ